ncbi:hypothetical protein PVAND_012882 [Polypedilum vanderplanki]|uniref:Myb-like domain-containing protein n=1 Tax=Polypedilum vanderplanki TaxID=319348 RepID=A0A9J6CN02_POLVA|nr:hypothetical protein PVAND_012882 [Polypedilum vanderplanki]
MQRRQRIKTVANLSTARRPKLNISKSAGTTLSKHEECDDKNKKNEDEVFESPLSSPQASNTLPQNNEQRQVESPIFSPPSTPFSPLPPTRSRCENSREISESPGLIINHNVHHLTTPQSPFIPIPHSRIRTESICSLKSTTTVANLQPRKKVRTEDQKILDNKRESRERLSNKQIEKSQLRMFDMIYYNPSTNPMKPRETQKERLPKKIDLTAELPETPVEIEPPTAMPVPQLRLNANGEMVLDESSLVVENEEQKKNRILLANTNVVLHDDSSGSYGYYKRQKRTREWPQDETIKFFRCLNTVGTDFSLMLNLFPNRSRRDLKLKFKKEEKNNPSLVDKALRNHSVFDIEELQRELEEEDEARRKEAESKSSEVKELVKRKILSKQEAKAKSQQHVKSKIQKILSDGDSVLNTVDSKVTQEIKDKFQNSTDTMVKLEINKSPIEFTMDHSNLKSERITYDSYSSNINDEHPQQSVETQSNNDSLDNEFVIDNSNMKSETSKRNAYGPYSSNINDDQPPQSVESQSQLDDETFLNSLDLERLVIVVKQVDGESIYDIHETDAITQKLSEKPLKLPRHIVDLIVSVMTQDD